MKKYILFCWLAFTFIACDVRKSDRVVDDVKLTHSVVKKISTAIPDNTMVQLIDSVYNFGKVTEGEKVTFNFRFKNTGTNPLVITSTTASCGCTVPEKPEKPVMPGETGFIKVVFNSMGRAGHNEKTITVMANTNPAFPSLVLNGDVTEAK
ncbi:MAG: DUF1573 domain-containing protein [Ferruginibacter sp.]